jgi:hypothetical protein
LLPEPTTASLIEELVYGVVLVVAALSGLDTAKPLPLDSRARLWLLTSLQEFFDARPDRWCVATAGCFGQRRLIVRVD